MSKSDDLRKAVKNMQHKQTAQIFWAEIVSVDENTETCTIKTLSGLEIEDVLLSIEKSGIIQIPAVNSKVLVCSIENQKAVCYLIAIEEVVKYYLRTEEKIVFNNENFAGLVKIEDLTQKLNSLVNDFNAFVAKYNSHIHITTATVGASVVPGILSPTATSASITSSFNKNDYENAKVLHG